MIPRYCNVLSHCYRGSSATESNANNGNHIGDARRTYEIQNGTQMGARDVSLTSGAVVDDAISTRGMIDQEDRKDMLGLGAC